MLFESKSKHLSQQLEYYLTHYYEVLTELKQLSNPLVGYFTNKIPIELIESMKVHPFRIFAFKHPQAQQGAYERYIQTFSCSWLREILDNGLVGGYNDVKGIIFSTGTCDSLQNVSDVWQKVFPFQLAYNLTFPIRGDETASKYLENEFNQLISFVQAQWNGTNGRSLKESIGKYNLKRQILQEVSRLVSKGQLFYVTLAKLIYFSDILPVDEFIRIFHDFPFSDNDNNESHSNQEKIPRLLVSGGMWDNWELFDIPEWNGLVADDLSFGYRNYNYRLPETDSLKSYVDAQLNRVPEPTMYDENQRLCSLGNQIKEHNVDGVVLLTMKFCDPDAFELVSIRKYLETLDIPFLNLETSSDLPNIGQLRTRLAAFSELLL